MLGYIDRVAVELLHHMSMLLSWDRIGVVAALDVALPKMLSGCLILWMQITLLLVEYALELRLFDRRLGHQRLPIG